MPLSFLGKIGIDYKLLIAQMVNFSVLFWILSKYLYPPILKRIERDEAELEKARQEREKIEREKRELMLKKEQILKEAQERARFIIQEAELAREKMKKDFEKERLAIEENFQSQFEKEKRGIREEFEKEIKKEIIAEKENKIRAFIQESFPKESLLVLQGDFFEKLKKAVKNFKFEIEPETQRLEIFLYFAFPVKEKEKKELEEILAKKLKIIYYFDPDREEKEKLKKILERKLGIVAFFREKEKKDLISGFTLEVAGFLFEANLATEIKKIFYENSAFG